MKIFLLFLLAILVVTAAHHVPTALEKCKLQYILLKEIIDDVKGMRVKKVLVENVITPDNYTVLVENVITPDNYTVLVENVITPDNCTHENFCKAGIVLSAFKAEKLRLKEEDWLLPRRLIAYTRDTSCNIMASAEQVQFLQLLENIKYCAQKEYQQPCNQMGHSKL